MFDFFRVRPKTRRVKIKKEGVIFSNPSKPKQVVFRLGTGVLLVSFCFLVYLYYPLGEALFFYETRKNYGDVVDKKDDRELVYEDKVLQNLDDFYLEVPDIFAVSKVMANVSVLDKNEYLPILANNVVAHAKGSAFPGDGEGKSIYLFAHSTSQNYSLVRKNAVFYLLGKLEVGNEVVVDFSGREYRYEVYDSKVVSNDEVSYLNYKVEGEETLLMQTCWPLGTNWNRLIVFARLITII